jgi:hypothetical protein
MDPSNDDTGPVCTTSATDWATLVITIISINMTWWLLEIPLIWKHGFKRYFYSVTWQCFRMYMPCCAAIVALLTARSSQEEPYIFYVGPFDNGQIDPQAPNIEITSLPARTEPEPAQPETPTRALSRFQLIKSLAVDGATILGTALTINTTINAPAGTSKFGASRFTWMYPTLPVALFGLWLLLCGTWLRWRRKWTCWLGMLLVVAVGAAMTAPVAVSSPTHTWYPAILGYAFMGLPILAYPHGVIITGGILLGFVARVGGVGIGALSPAANFPFCQLRHPAFGALYLTIGGIGAILAFVGWFKFLWRLEGVAENPRNKDWMALVLTTTAHAPSTRAGRPREPEHGVIAS